MYDPSHFIIIKVIVDHWLCKLCGPLLYDYVHCTMGDELDRQANKCP